jgi:hypothetical protein
VARLGAVRKKKLRGKGGVAVLARWSAVDFRSSVGFACRLVGRQGRFSHLNTRHSPDRPNPPPNPQAHPPKKNQSQQKGGTRCSSRCPCSRRRRRAESPPNRSKRCLLSPPTFPRSRLLVGLRVGCCWGSISGQRLDPFAGLNQMGLHLDRVVLGFNWWIDFSFGEERLVE